MGNRSNHKSRWVRNTPISVQLISLLQNKPQILFQELHNWDNLLTIFKDQMWLCKPKKQTRSSIIELKTTTIHTKIFWLKFPMTPQTWIKFLQLWRQITGRKQPGIMSLEYLNLKSSNLESTRWKMNCVKP